MRSRGDAGKRTVSGPPGRSVRTIGCFTDGHGQGPRGAHSGFACECCGRRRPVCQEGCGGFCVPIFCRGGAWWIERFREVRGPGAAGAVWPVRPRCGKRGGTACELPFRGQGGPAVAGAAPRGAYGRPCRIRACGAAWACNSDVPADGFHAPGSTACSAASGLVPADPSSVPGWVMWPAAAGGRCHRWRAGWGAVMAGHIIITARQAS